jgi:hypothetical protein
MKLDRGLQLELLKQLADLYPNLANTGQMASENSDIMPNLLYLAEHGLIAGNAITTNTSGTVLHAAKITAKGMDFLADDGGLSAILGVVTIRLHDDTIRELIALKIQDSDLPQPDKHRLLDQLRELRGESIKHLTMKLLDAGLENWQKALPLVQKALESFG